MLVNVDEFDKAAGENEDPSKIRYRRKVKDGMPIYADERARRELYQAENAKLDLEERLGRLTIAEEVEHRQMTVFRMVRDRCLGIPATACEKLATAPDARAIRQILDLEIRGVLDKLASDLDKMADDDGDVAGE